MNILSITDVTGVKVGPPELTYRDGRLRTVTIYTASGNHHVIELVSPPNVADIPVEVEGVAVGPIGSTGPATPSRRKST